MDAKKMKSAAAAAVMTVGLMSSPGAISAVSGYIKIGDIKGESTTIGFKDWIDVLSWNWGTKYSGVGTDVRPIRGATLCVSDMMITKSLDSASPELILSSVFADPIPQAELVLQRTSGADSRRIMSIKLFDVIVNSYSTASASGQDQVTEAIALNFRSASGEYIPQAPTGGSATPISFELDASNSKCK